MFIVHLNIAVIFFIISMSLLKYTAINIFHILSFNLFSKKLQLSIYLLFIDYIYGSYVSVVYDLFKIIIYKIRDRFYFFNIVSHFIYLNNIFIGCNFHSRAEFIEYRFYYFIHFTLLNSFFKNNFSLIPLSSKHFLNSGVMFIYPLLFG